MPVLVRLHQGSDISAPLARGFRGGADISLLQGRLRAAGELIDDHVEYAVVPPSEGVPKLYFATVPEPKAAKNRVHLDLIPPGDDQHAELARLVGLGATVSAEQPPGASWIILADPEGNEFCLEG